MDERFEKHTSSDMPGQHMWASPEPPKKKGRGTAKLIILCVVFLVIGVVVGSVSSSNISGLGNDGKKGGAEFKNLTFIEDLVDDMFLYDVDQEAVETEVYRGYMKGLKDDYAEYYTKKEFDELMEEDSGEYYGIGVTLYKDPDTNYPCVSEVFKDNPAYKAGIKSGDFLISVDGESSAELSLQDFIAKVKSPDSEKVKFEVLRGKEILKITVDKKKVVLSTVEWSMKEDKIGYISVSQFIETTPADFHKAIDDLKSKGMEKLIIDLRDNGGGLVDSCQKMLSEFIEDGELLVYTEDKDGDRDEYKSKNDEVFVSVPTVILINENTASASEIMTGCMKDYDLATVVGEKSFGKGIVQSIIPLQDGSAVKFTVSKYYTPKGNDIHKKGITPDVEVKMTDEQWAEAAKDASKDTQLKKAIEILKKK